MQEKDANTMTPGKAYAPICQGGDGSGNFGHDGRPGERGGSGEGGGSAPVKAAGSSASTDKSLISSMSKASNRDTGTKIAADTEKGLSEHLAYGQSDAIQNSEEVGHYTGVGYAGMNSYLRGDITEEKAKTLQVPVRIGDLSKIDAAISGAPKLPDGTVLYRGVGERGVSAMMNMQPGDTCEDKAFQSFSTSPFNASSFTTAKGNDKVMIRAITDGSVKGLAIGGSEHEVLMPRGTKWAIVSNNPVKSGRITTHVITVVPA